MDNLQIAQEINARIGNSPVPFDSVYSIAYLIYQELGGEGNNFDSVYSILLEILPLASETAHVIDDSSISLSKTWSSSKISSELADAGFKTQFVNELPATGDIHTIYFVPSGSALTGNVYDEYMWNASASEWEQVGSTAIDLTDIINDASVLSNRTWSSEKINSELEALAGDANSEIVAAETIDVTFVDTVPSEAGTEGQYVIYVTEAEDTLYKYENGAWEVQTIDANKLYFDTENNVLYSYKSATHKFAEVGVDNTIIFSGSITSNAAKTALNPIKTPGVYNVLQHQTSSGKTTMTNWVMTVTFLDSNEADEVDGSVYQKLENNYTVYKRYYKPTTDTWTSMTKYYEGLVRDSLTSSAYYTWSVNKIKNAIAAAVAEVPQLEAGDNISIEDGKINAIGYKANNSPTGSFVELPEYIIESYTDMTSQLPTTDLNFTGDAGATEYIVSGQLSSMLSSMVDLVAFQVGSGNIALLTAYDSTNSKVTLNKTLDENNALSATPMSKFYMVILAMFSGSANATTYSYTDNTGGAFHGTVDEGMSIKIGDYKIAKILNITSNSITLDSTLDADNAVSNAAFMYAISSNNTASGVLSHAEGSFTLASGPYSHSEGYGTITQNNAEHAQGKYNVSHTSTGITTVGKTLHSIGVGSGSGLRKNAIELMQNADMYVYGVGGYQGTDTKVQNASILTVQEVINSKADAYQVATNAEIDMLFVPLTTVE